ncbi:MAG: hypothetical protein ACK5Q7_16975 [Cyanobacteriota bacterium]|jgi:hypothetical protein
MFKNSNYGTNPLLGRLDGWKRQVAENSNEKPLIRLVLALEGSQYMPKYNAVVARIHFDEKILYNNRRLIKAALGESVMVYSSDSLAKKLAKEYLDYAHIEIKNTAKQEGWYPALEEYLVSAALTQAQFIVGAKATYAVPPHREATEEHVDAYIIYCQNQAETGEIKVPLNQEIINAAKEQRVRFYE